MSTTPIPMPAPQTENPSAQAEYMRQLLMAQGNTQGMTQMAPGGTPQPPITQQRTQPGPQQTSAFGVGERGAHQRQSMQNLVKAAQGTANQFAQYAEAKQQRDYQQTVGKFTQATQGVAQAQAQIVQATQALKQNPQDAQAQAQLKQAQGALQQNQAILNDMANDKKQHKIITKAFGIDDKNADSPERKAAMKVLQDQSRPSVTTQVGAFSNPDTGQQVSGGQPQTVQGPPAMNQNQARIQAQIPQTQQLSPQAQAQSQMQQAGVMGKPATQGQILSAYGKMYDSGVKAGLTQEKLDLEMNKRGLTVKTDDDGNRLYNEDGTPQLRPMTQDEINENPITKSQMEYKAAQTAYQKAAADAKTDPSNPDMQIRIADAQAKMLSARAAMLKAQKYVPGGAETPQKKQDTQYLAQQLVSRKLAPSELPAFGATRAEAMAAASKLDPSYDPAKSEIQYQYSKNPANQATLTNINTLVGSGSAKGSMDELIAQAGRVKRTQFPPVNSAEMAAIIARGDGEAAAYGAVALDVSDQIAKILQGGGSGSVSSDKKLTQAQAALNRSFNKDQLAKTIRETKVLLENRKQAMLSSGGPFLKAQQEDMSAGDAPDASGDDPAGLFK